MAVQVVAIPVPPFFYFEFGRYDCVKSDLVSFRRLSINPYTTIRQKTNKILTLRLIPH